MKIRVIQKSHENGSGEQIYICTDETDFDQEPEHFFFMKDGESIDMDTLIEGGEFGQLLGLPFDRPLTV